MYHHNRFSWLGLLACGILTLSPALLQAAGPPAKRLPNIVYFVIDELGYYELSCMGHPEMRTPNVDRLAAEGVRFTQCLAGNCVCAPTRCCLMTGKHTGHASVRTNAGYEPMRADEATIASVLKQAGYAAGGFGKWGCGGRGTSGVPEKHGFDVFFGYYDQVHAHTYYPRYLLRNSVEVPLLGNTGDYHTGKTFSHYLIVEEAKQFIRANKDRPFFAYLPWTPPHGQWGMPREDPSWQLYKDKPWSYGSTSKDDAKIYAAMVNMVDRQVGEVLALLKELGLEENTIVFFSGDNGGWTYFADAEHPAGLFGPNVNPKTGQRFRGSKTNLYEGGLRVPMLVRWPGKIRGGRVSELLCYFHDLLPTLAELTGAPCPKDLDGLSLLPELLGETAVGHKQEQHEYLYWEFNGWAAVRMGNWKAVRPPKATAWELYDLAKDLGETHNLAEQRPEILAKMKAYAEQAHTPLRPGDIYDKALVDKDRRLKLPERP
jgi:arylsulfatase A-like enzyme